MRGASGRTPGVAQRTPLLVKATPHDAVTMSPRECTFDESDFSVVESHSLSVRANRRCCESQWDRQLDTGATGRIVSDLEPLTIAVELLETRTRVR